METAMLAGLRQTVAARPYDNEVAYLESDGGQYIDTGLVLDADDVVTCDFSFTTRTSCAVFGARSGVSDHNISCGITASGEMVVDMNNGNYDSYRAQTSSQVGAGSYSATISRSQRIIKLNGTGIAFSYGEQNASFSCPVSCYLFFGHGTGAGSWWSDMGKFVGRISSFRVTRDGKPRMDLAPVRTMQIDGDWLGAMYDRVSGAMLYNRGSGAFTCGSVTG